MYVPIIYKFWFNLFVATLWFCICFYISIPWIKDLALYVGLIPAAIIVLSIALIPGFMFMFLLVSYLTDQRKNKAYLGDYPPLTVLIAAYNEENSIAFTLNSLKNQNYPAPIEIILIDDGSSDKTIGNPPAK